MEEELEELSEFEQRLRSVHPDKDIWERHAKASDAHKQAFDAWAAEFEIENN